MIFDRLILSLVSQDPNIAKILETHHEIDLVISASSLKCITDTSDPKKRWMMPVVVKEITSQRGNIILYEIK